MNKILNRIGVLLCAFVLIGTSCSEEFFDVKNRSELSISGFYQTEADFEKALITCYMPMGYNGFFGVQYHLLGFAMEDRVIHEQLGTQNLEYTATNEAIGNVFYSCYIGVFRTNIWIEKLNENKPVIAAGRLTQMWGEILYMRAFYNFYLASHFEVAPLLTYAPKDPSVGIPNSTQEELYAQVELDLKSAIDSLPVTWPATDYGRASKGAALTLLGKTYLYQGKFELAAQTLAQVIDLGIYDLNMPQGTDSLDYVYAYLANFSPIDLVNGSKIYDSEFNSESIFEINYSNAYAEGGRNDQYLPLRRSTGSHMTWFHGPSNLTGGFGNVGMDDKLYPNSFEPISSHEAGLKKDPRYYSTVFRVGETVATRDGGTAVVKGSDIAAILNTTLGLRKHLYPFHTGSGAPFYDETNWRVFRYADVLLMYAEAGLRSGISPAGITPLQALNRVRERAGLEARASLTREYIIYERDKELVAEHSRFWDLVRWYKDGWMTLAEVQAIKPRFEPKHVCWPIPQGQIDINNGVLKQNPKWL